MAEANASLRAEMAQHKETESERLRLAAAAEQASESIVITDRDGVIHDTNPAFERATGLKKEALVGRSYGDFLTGGDVDRDFKETLLDVGRMGMNWSFHFSRPSPGGQAHEFDITFSPIRDRAGALVSYLAIERNVTEQYELDQIVRRSQKMEALGTLAGGIAHDFNNILTPIILNMELALLDLPEAVRFDPTSKRLSSLPRGGRSWSNRSLPSAVRRSRRGAGRPRRRRPGSPEVPEPSWIPKTIEIRDHCGAESAIVPADSPSSIKCL